MPQKEKYNLPDINSNHDIGRNISIIRKNHGLSQCELANKIGITQSLLSKYEIGKLNVPAEIIIQVSITLEIDSNIILGLKKVEEKDHFPKKMIERLKLIEQLPPFDKKALLKTIDNALNGVKTSL